MSNKHLELLHLAQDKNSDNPSHLLSQGANPNIRDPFYHKWTPLHYAASLNKEHFVLQLLQHPKTNATLVDSDGFSPLYWASKKGSSPRIINALLSKGCDPNERDMHGMTALFAAVASNNKDNVECLVKHPSININQVNQFGGSALHHTAFATDNVEIADVLVRHGANLFLFDYEKQRPLHVAKRRNRESLFKYFKDKMKEQQPTYICDVFMDESETSDYEENDNDNKSLPRTQHCSMSNPIPIKAKPKPQRQISASPEPIINTVNTPWYSLHQKKIKKVQENKLKIALKMEQSDLNKNARHLLQEQQIHFEYEHELFYSSMKHEYDKLHYQRNHYINLTKDLIKTNTQLKHENIKLKMALKYMKIDTNKEFKEWFKKEIGTDFMQYYDYFVSSGFDDLRTIRYITNERQLIDLGIHKKGHRLHILDRIGRMNDNEVALAASNANVMPHNEIDCVEGCFGT